MTKEIISHHLQKWSLWSGVANSINIIKIIHISQHQVTSAAASERQQSSFLLPLEVSDKSKHVLGIWTNDQFCPFSGEDKQKTCSWLFS